MKALILNPVTKNSCKKRAQERIKIYLILSILLVPVLSLRAADKKNNEEFEPKVIDTVLPTKDGWLIPITYYQSALREKAPLLIFLHGKNGNRLNWDNYIAPKFNEYGYTVITVDLRKHGKSKAVGKNSEKRNDQKIKSNDYKLMVAEDMEAVKNFIYIENQQKNLNMRKTAIIATDMSAPIALVFAFRDWMKLPYQDGPTLETSTPRGQDIRALILISPDDSLPGLNASKILKDLKDPSKNMAILTVVGSKDNRDKGQAEKIYRKLDGKKGDPKSGRFQFHQEKTKYRGYNFIKNSNVFEKVYEFLDENFKPISDPWRDRESQYNK